LGGFYRERGRVFGCSGKMLSPEKINLASLGFQIKNPFTGFGMIFIFDRFGWILWTLGKGPS